jgi:hypothetical protein
LLSRGDFEPTDGALGEIQELTQEYGDDLYAQSALVARSQRGRHNRDIVGQDVNDADRLLRASGFLIRSRRVLPTVASVLIALGTIGLTLTYSAQGSPSQNPVCFFAGLVFVAAGVALHFL